MIRLLIFALLVFMASSSQAKLLVSPEEALKSMLAGVGEFKGELKGELKKETLHLSENELKKIKDETGVELPEADISLYRIREHDKLSHWAVLLTQKVRSKDQTSLFLIDLNGKIKAIETIAFNEAIEYVPRKNWLNEFSGKGPEHKSKIADNIPMMTSATYTSQSIQNSVKVLWTIWEIKLKQEKP